VAAAALHLDRERFELLGYCTQATMGPMTERLKGALPWADVTRLNDEALLARLREDRLDILVETIGNTPGNRATVLVRRAAPIQVTCIGDPRTSGLPTMDYRIVDEITDPPGSDHFCTEKLARLPGCFLCYEPHDDAPEPSRGSGSAGVVFGSFNVTDKTGPQVIETWARILREVPGSRMVMRAHGFRYPAVRELYAQRFAAGGIGPERLELTGHMPEMSRHLAQYHRIDIALDPFPYNGTTTTCDCLWMGVPLVTLRGSWHASRVGASLLTAVGLQELVAEDRDGLVRRAAALASDPARLDELHRTLRQRMAASPLGDAPAYAAKLGEAYRAMWRARCAEARR
jgi:protein O-GlcNAc transferase